jgi:hypothetical protein
MKSRPHQGRWCFDKARLQTFLYALPLTKEKNNRGLIEIGQQNPAAHMPLSDRVLANTSDGAVLKRTGAAIVLEGS